MVKSLVAAAAFGCICLGAWRHASVDLTAASQRADKPAAAVPSGPPAADVPLPKAMSRADRPALVQRYCVTCHNRRLKTAGLALDETDSTNLAKDPGVWEKVVRKLRLGAMPPTGLPRPDEPTTMAFVASLEQELDRLAAATPKPGRPLVHRLNRVEYGNAIRDLLALEIDSSQLLPADDSSHGFDNIADVLTLSPGLLDRYLSAATRISRLAVGDASIRSSTTTYTMPTTMTQLERMSDDLPFGTRGGLAVRHSFPADGEYIIKLRLQKRNTGEIRGLGEPDQIEVRVGGTRVKVFDIGGRADGPTDDPQRRGDGGRDPRRDSSRNADRIQYQLYADERLEVRFPARAGTQLVTVAFPKRSQLQEGMRPRHYPVATYSYKGDFDLPMGIDQMQVLGPYNVIGTGDTPSRQRILICRPAPQAQERPCAARIMSTLARRAYRRPVTAHDVETLMAFYDASRKEGDFESGIRSAIERMLVEPDFLFRAERAPAGVRAKQAYRLPGIELASRLSFFLWSSIPDDELLTLAERGMLKDPRVLSQQVRRMLGDERAKALMKNFAGQWLYLRNMQAVTPDSDIFPNFDENLREAFQHETELFMESQLRDDRSVLDLLTADYTFLNERLARHYGVANVYGGHFRRVELPAGTPRRGLLGQGSVLTITSYATRTSPVLRGKWILEKFMGTPPPPPPPDVPDLPEKGGDGQPKSVRELMEQHRRNPGCASCHRLMDPLGFALENFDAIGQYRTVGESGRPLDTSGTLPDGAAFTGLEGLQRALLSRPREFAFATIEKLLTYALGRGLTPADAAAVRNITRQAGSDYRWSTIIQGIVTSVPFQMRTSDGISGTVQ
jgi:hypothetical protein